MATLLAGCGSGGNIAGNGNRPDHIVVEMVQNNVPILNTGTIYQCQAAQMRALLVFTDGSVGDFTNRVTWSTDATGGTQVSNGDIPVDPNNVTAGNYGYGVLIPGESTAPVTINASYESLVGHFKLSVASPDAGSFLIVDGSDTVNTSIATPQRFESNYLKPPITQAGTGTLWLGTGTAYQLKVLASLGGVESDVSAFARWTFDFGGDPSVVTINTLGQLSALRAGATQTLRASFPGCTTQLTLPVAVADIRGLSIQQDPLFFDSQQQKFNPLIVGNDERLLVLADLGQDPQGRAIPQQDVSGVVNFWVSNSSLLATIPSGTAAIASALAPGSAITLQASQIFANQAEVQSPLFQMDTTTGILSSMAVSPPSAEALQGLPPGCRVGTTTLPALKTGSACYSQFTATGTYILPDGTPLSQDVTRTATWALSDTTIASIGSGLTNGGQVTAPTAEPANVETITVSIPGESTDIQATTTLQLQ